MRTTPPTESVLLNCWNYHLPFIRQQIQEYSEKGLQGLEELCRDLEAVQTPSFDLYTGPTPPEVLKQDVWQQLEGLGISQPEIFRDWVGAEEQNYRILHLSDLSFWILKAGPTAEQYIEMVPGRYSYLTIRMNADSLKSAIMACTLGQIEGARPQELELVNQIRQAYLGLEPLKQVPQGGSLDRMCTMIAKPRVAEVVVV